MSIIDYFTQHNAIFLIFCTVNGLIVGSFLNVVIYRLPVMLERSWKAECSAILELKPTIDPPSSTEPKFNLIVPNSHCPKCQRPVRAWENIPVISYLLLRGKCAGCATPIAKRYPAIELLSGLLSLVVAWQLGPSWITGMALLLTWCLIALTFIDIDHQLLPDNITLPLLWLGLAINSFAGFVPLADAVWGAIAGYLILWLVYWGFKLLTGKEGMGYGDFKLLAALGAWLGWQSLPVIIILSSFVGALIGIALICIQGRDKSIPIPFGPYLAIAGWICLLWGQDLLSLYLSAAGLQ
jgi:leader peptidase (prepilin peptidase)/N-methyltransferase